MDETYFNLDLMIEISEENKRNEELKKKYQKILDKQKPSMASLVKVDSIVEGVEGQVFYLDLII